MFTIRVRIVVGFWVGLGLALVSRFVFGIWLGQGQSKCKVWGWGLC